MQFDLLEDPFEMLPLQGVLRALGALADELEERAPPRLYAAPKYWTDEDFYHIEVSENLIGSAFVVCQATITRTVSLVKRMANEQRELARQRPEVPQPPDWMNRKADILRMAAPIHIGTGCSKIALIDSVANCYKHHFEWATDWSGPQPAMSTINVVVQLGLGPGKHFNMEHAVRELEISGWDLSALGHMVSDWRESLGVQLRRTPNNAE